MTRTVLSACAVLMTGATVAQAASATWDGLTDSLWSDANWGGVYPVPGIGDTATFNNAGNGNTTIDLGSGVEIGSLVFDTASAAAYTIGAGAVGSQTLTLDAGGGITLSNAVVNNQLFNANLSLGTVSGAKSFGLTNNSAGSLTLAGAISSTQTDTNTVTVAGTNTIVISGNISNGSGAVVLNKVNAGTLILSGNNNLASLSFPSGVNSGNQGAVRVTSSHALDGASVTMLGQNTTTQTLELANNVTITNNINSRSRDPGSAMLRNVSGTNTYSGTFNATATGGGITFESAAGKLTLSGALIQTGISARGLTLQGAGLADISYPLAAANISTVTKSGTGTWILSGASTYTGATTVSGGTLLVNGSTSSSAVTVNSGTTLGGTGTVGGATTISGNLVPGANGVGTLTFSTNLTLSAGAAAYFELSSSYTSGNDKVVVGKNLSLSSANTIHISALSGAANLGVGDYVLFSVSGTTTMSTTPALVWDGTVPANYLNYTLAQSGNNVVLHYSAASAPTVTATASPSNPTHNQAVTITATVTPGSGTVTNVNVDLTQIGGAATAALVLANNNVYTNTFAVSSGTILGAKSLTVTVTDNTPLTGTYALTALTVTAGNHMWNGAGADNNWGSNPNWANSAAPGYMGDSVTFAGTTRLTPTLETNYSVSGVTFDSTAGGFNLTNANASALTLTGGVANNSANPQTVSVPLVLSGAQTFNAAAGNLTLGQNITNAGNLVTVAGNANTVVVGVISGSGGLTKTNSGTLTLLATNSFSGSLFVKGGTVVIDSGAAVSTGGSYISIGQDGNDNGTLTLKGTGALTTTSDFNVGDIGNSAGTLNIQDNANLSVSALFVGSANAASSAASGTVNQTGGTVTQTSTALGTFTIGGRSSATTSGVGVYNLSGGTLVAKAPVRMSGYGKSTFNQSGGLFTAASTSGGINLQRYPGPGGTYNLNGGTFQTFNIAASVAANDPTFYSVFNFNGGTLQPTANNSTFMQGLSQANVRDGGAVIDTAGFNITINQLLAQSYLSGDAGTGGLTKLGNGTLVLGGGYSYAGATRVLGGTLSLVPGAGVPGIGGDLLVSNAVLVVDASSMTYVPANNVALKTGATLTITNSAYTYGINAAGNLSLETNVTLNLNYGTLYSANPSAAALNVAGGLTVSGTNIVINIGGSGFSVGQFPLIAYTGSSLPALNQFKLGTLPVGVNATLVNNTANKTIDLNISLIGQSLTWYGAYSDGTILPNWNINSSTNWNYGTLTYLEYGTSTNLLGDLVTFDDNVYNNYVTAPATNVNLTSTLHPAKITVSSVQPYSFSGSGSLAGSGSLTMNGPGTLTLSTSNSYTGGTFVTGGALIIANDNQLGAVAGGVTLSGGTLQLNGVTSARGLTVTANSSIGVMGNANSLLSGVLTGAGGLNKVDAGTLTLTGSNTLTGNIFVKSGALVLDSGGSLAITTWSSIGQNSTDVGTLTLKGTSSFTTTSDFNVGDLDSSIGTLNIQDNANLTANAFFVGSANATGSTASGTVNQTGGSVTENSSGIGMFAVGGRTSASGVGTYNLSGGTLTANAGIRVGGTGTGTFNQSGGTVFAKGGVNIARIGGSTGTYNLNGGTLSTYNIASSTGTNAVFNFNGGLLQALNPGSPFISGLSQATVLAGGAFIDSVTNNITITQPLLNGGTGGGLTKLGTGTLYLDGTNTYTGSTIVSNGTLAGIGTIAGPVVVKASGSIAAGDAGSLGTLTINNNLSLQGEANFRISKTGGTRSNDLIQGVVAANYGGTLVISNATTDASALAVGDTFTLFNAATHSGNFTNIVGSPGSGLAYAFTNGVLSVVSAASTPVPPPAPTLSGMSKSGNDLVLTWVGGTNQSCVLLSATNVAQPRSTWSVVATNVVLSDGRSTNTIPVNAAEAQRFYLLTVPYN